MTMAAYLGSPEGGPRFARVVPRMTFGRPVVEPRINLGSTAVFVKLLLSGTVVLDVLRSWTFCSASI